MHSERNYNVSLWVKWEQLLRQEHLIVRNTSSLISFCPYFYNKNHRRRLVGSIPTWVRWIISFPFFSQKLGKIGKSGVTTITSHVMPSKANGVSWHYVYMVDWGFLCLHFYVRDVAWNEKKTFSTCVTVIVFLMYWRFGLFVRLCLDTLCIINYLQPLKDAKVLVKLVTLIFIGTYLNLYMKKKTNIIIILITLRYLIFMST